MNKRQSKKAMKKSILSIPFRFDEYYRAKRFEASVVATLRARK